MAVCVLPGTHHVQNAHNAPNMKHDKDVSAGQHTSNSKPNNASSSYANAIAIYSAKRTRPLSATATSIQSNKHTGTNFIQIHNHAIGRALYIISLCTT